MRYLYIALGLLAFSPIYSQSILLKWEAIAPGVWKAVVGQPESIHLLGVAGISPKTQVLNKLGERNFPEFQKSAVYEIFDHKVYLRFPLKEKEQLYGLGLNFKSVRQRGTVKTLHVDHYGGRDDGRTHAPVPFYVSDQGYGILINSARYLTVYAGTGVRKDSPNPPEEKDRNTRKDWDANPYSDAVEVLVPATGTEVFLFAGNTPLEVVQRYNLYTGGGVLPPLWGLGFTHRTPTLFTDKDVLNEVEEFEKKGYPLSFVGLEPGWQSHAYPNSFVWDQGRFPDPASFIKRLLEKNIRVNLWLNPYASTKSPVYKDLIHHAASHTVWVGVVPDFHVPTARELYKKLFNEQHLSVGVSGYKIDETDGYDTWLWPDVTRFPSGFSAEQIRQTYGLQIQKMTADWFRERNQRTYGLSRASNAGASALPYVIYNDYYNHRDFITALCNSSFIGVLWTPEARSSATSEEWLRRMQAVCLSPMAMLNAWADGTKPWSFPEVAEAVKEVMLLRMQLLPYLYTTFAQYHFEGKPPVRAMPLNDDGQFFEKDIRDQFFLGEYLLVAPFFAGERSRQVVLPKGKWYDFYTGALAGENQIIEVHQSTPGPIPLYVKEGGFIPMIPPQLIPPKKNESLPLVVRYYGTQPSQGNLYDDDGETFDYEKGQYSWSELKAKKDPNGQWRGAIATPSGKPFRYVDIQWEWMVK